MLKKVTNTQRGFTLIELLVVIAIIGILSGIVVTSLGGQRARARDSRRVSELQSAALAMQIYFDSNNRYPADLDDLQAAGLIAKTLRDPNDATTNGGKYYYDGYTSSAWTGTTATVGPGTSPIQTACPTSGLTCQGFHIAATLETNDANLMSGADGVDMTASPPASATIKKTGIGFKCNSTTASAANSCYDLKNH